MVIDVKMGNGAFMRDESRTTALAYRTETMWIKTRALLTDMNQPLEVRLATRLKSKNVSTSCGEFPDAARPVLDLCLSFQRTCWCLPALKRP
jgi:hypothetical protein